MKNGDLTSETGFRTHFDTLSGLSDHTSTLRLPDEQGEEARNFAFELLIHDSMLMYQGTLLDARLREFYLEMKEGNSGIIEQITGLLQEENNQAAMVMNSTITPGNL